MLAGMRSATLLLLLVPLLAACGGSTPPASSTPAPDAGSTAASVDAGSGDDMKGFAGVDLGEPPPAASSAPPAASTPPPAPEPKDECTPVGIDFEKRARPKLNECYREGKKKNPNLEGAVRIVVSVDTLGKIKSIKIGEKTFPDEVANCMLAVVKKTPFTEVSKCPGKDITIPITRPTK
jgi:hypothetical protein